MGICGLTTFLNRNVSIFYEEYKLHNSLVIVDGYALTNFLYKLYEQNTSAFGGDYDIIVKLYVDFINLLLRCNVTPIFVFDGSFEERKFQTLLNRRIDRIQTYAQPIKTNSCMPCFGSHIIFEILNDMDIPHVKCDFEADAEIVALAKIFNCPVMSRDSDFFINTVPVIHLDMVILDFKSTDKFINCKLYKVENLLNRFGGLNIKYLPLVSTLLGNDYIAPDTFASLLDVKPFNVKVKLERITNWLRNQKNVKSAINNIIDNLTSNKSYIRMQINTIIKEYKKKDSMYLSFLLQYKMMSKHRYSLKAQINDKPSILPYWLECNFRKGTVASEIVTMYTSNTIFLMTQIEDFEKLPGFLVAFKILKCINGLIFGQNHSIRCFGRKNGINLGQYNLTSYVKNTPGVALADLNKTNLEYRKRIILDLIGLQTLNGLPKKWELFIIILIYWINQTNNRKSEYMYALIICAITLNIIKQIMIDSQNETCENNPTDKSIIEENITKVKKEDCFKAMSALSGYFKVPSYEDKNAYKKIMHSFSQFQYCAYYMMILNSLLDFPFEQFRFDDFFKGTFLYNLTVKMQMEWKCQLFVTQQLFTELDSINIVFKSIIYHLEMLLTVSNERTYTT